jgi:hypothetical protein
MTRGTFFINGRRAEQQANNHKQQQAAQQKRFDSATQSNDASDEARAT